MPRWQRAGTMGESHVFATAGHVDHGKSALIRALTGIEPDRWEEERRRGMTLDLGFAWMRLDDDVSVAFVDVPGHERYVPTMLAGAGPVAGVLFVVAADEGWSAQSTEHLQGLQALGVSDGILVITKSDLLEPELAEAESREHLVGAGLGSIPSVAVSARTGAGLDDLRREMRALARRLPSPNPRGDVRLWLDRAFSISGAGTVVTGTLTDGTLRAGDELDLSSVRGADPKRVRIRGLQSAGQDRDTVSGATRVAVNLRGIRPDEAPRGSQLLSPDRFLRPTTFDALLVVGAEHTAERLPDSCTVHLGSASLQARVRRLGPDHLRLSVAAPVPVRIGDRLVLRDPGQHAVLGAAIVLDPAAPPLVRRGAAKARGRALASYSATPNARMILKDKGLMPADDLVRMGCLDVPPASNGWCLDPAYRASLTERLIAMVDEDVASDPDSRGVSFGAARRRLGLPDHGVLAGLLARIPQLGVHNGHVVSERHAAMSAQSAAALTRFIAEVRDNPFHSPEAQRLSELALDRTTLAVLCRHGALVELARGIYLTPDAVNEAAARLAGIPQPFTLGEGRAALGTTRRIAVPLMEYLNRIGRTRRVDGDKHAVTDRPAG